LGASVKTPTAHGDGQINEFQDENEKVMCCIIIGVCFTLSHPYSPICITCFHTSMMSETLDFLHVRKVRE
jgi:hypothetical protein